MPSETSKSRHAIAAAPAPEHTSVTSSIFLLTRRRPFFDRRAHDNGGAVLIVMEDRDLHAFAQFAFHDKAFRRLMSSRLMPPKVGSSAAITSTSLSGSFSLISISNTSIPANFFEQYAFAFHHRLAGEGADIAEAEHGGAIGDHRHQVAARGHVTGFGRIFDDGHAGCRHAGRISQRQIALAGKAFGGHDLDFARAGPAVIIEGLFFFSSSSMSCSGGLREMVVFVLNAGRAA